MSWNPDDAHYEFLGERDEARVSRKKAKSLKRDKSPAAKNAIEKAIKKTKRVQDWYSYNENN